jgi:hypothetical protein
MNEAGSRRHSHKSRRRRPLAQGPAGQDEGGGARKAERMAAKLARRWPRVAVWDQASGGEYQSIPERPTPVVVVPDCQADTRKSGIFIFMTPMIIAARSPPEIVPNDRPERRKAVMGRPPTL